MTTTEKLAQADAEIARCTAYIREGKPIGNPNFPRYDTGALLGLVDWAAEKRLMEAEGAR